MPPNFGEAGGGLVSGQPTEPAAMPPASERHAALFIARDARRGLHRDPLARRVPHRRVIDRWR